jgi:membrane peptidoglycan carboxypeptidase
MVFCGSIWVACQWTPSQMLAHLSETVYLGHGFHGINSASQGYFGLPAQDLTFSQMALLVAIWKKPHHFDPWYAPERAVNRANDFITKRNLRVHPVISLEELGVRPAPSNACEPRSR